ncbi:jg22197 [Pararge aegeria aegeria]|uniref:Jg22197 protein n=1 Tax=Pararge aegeria aegeria TaxID=348720 RepID=A0A8S4QVQ8_9NEOP|nr:jg22197 [Pararge aegeria aegeria]
MYTDVTGLVRGDLGNIMENGQKHSLCYFLDRSTALTMRKAIVLVLVLIAMSLCLAEESDGKNQVTVGDPAIVLKDINNQGPTEKNIQKRQADYYDYYFEVY